MAPVSAANLLSADKIHTTNASIKIFLVDDNANLCKGPGEETV